MTCELLGARRRAAHRQVRAERMTQAMDTALRELCAPNCAVDVVLDDLLRKRRAVPLTQHAGATQMPVLFEASRQTSSQRHVADATALGCRHVTLPVGPLDAKLSLRKIDITPLESHHFPEVRQVLSELAGVPRIVATLLYGAGLRMQG